MVGIVGIVVILVAVFGTYVLEGGKLAVVLEALPFELMTIFGAGVGAFVISNSMLVVKQTTKEIKLVFRGSRWAGKLFWVGSKVALGLVCEPGSAIVLPPSTPFEPLLFCDTVSEASK